MNYTEIANNMSNIDSLQKVLSLANTVTNDAFWTGMYWMILLVILLTTMVFGFETAMITTFFGGLIFGMFLLYLGLINPLVLGCTSGILIFAVIYLIWSGNKY